MSENTPEGHAPIPSPEAQELKDQCARLANELADLLTEKDHLATVVIPNITAQYASTVGARECEQLRLDVEVRRLKQILEHIQAIENRGDKANIEQVEAAVEDELQDWNAKLRQMADQVLAGKKLLARQMSDEETAEFRKPYRELVRRLHPDVNPDFAAKHRALWSRVQEAYRLGNLAELQALMLVVADVPLDTDAPNALDALRERRENLRAGIRATLDQIATLKQSPPFALLEKLEDPAWVADRLSQCDEDIAHLTERVRELADRLAAWKGANG